MPKRLFSLIISLLVTASAAAAVPAAPSDLRVTSQTWNAFKFSWRDNASNEARQKLYISEGGAPFYLLTAFKENLTAAALQHLITNRVYQIYLTAENADGESAASNTLRVLVSPPPLTAVMSWTPEAPTTLDTVQFTDKSYGSPQTRLWSFSDGTTSTLPNPSRRFPAGDHVVTLTVSKGTARSTTTMTIRVAGGSGGTQPLVAAFTCGECSAQSGETLRFTDVSSGAPASWNWSFGEGSTSTLQHPPHQFTLPGTYVVTLETRRDSDVSVTTKSVTITPPPQRRILLPAISRVNGSGGSRWRTELTITNRSAEVVSAELTLLGSNAPPRVIAFPPHASRYFADAVEELFALDNAAGALLVSINEVSGDALTLVSRTLTRNERGTYGQLIPSLLLGGPPSPLFLPALRGDDAYRTNVGFVNAGATEARVTVRVIGTAAMFELTLPRHSFRQQSLESLLGAQREAALEIERSSGDVFAYASVIDNGSNDPSYIAATRRPSETELLIPSVGRLPGLNDTIWQSELTLLNPEAIPINLTILFQGIEKKLALAAHSQMRLDDVVLWLGFERALGPLRIRAEQLPVATSRTFTRNTAGSFGQTISPQSATRNGSATLTGIARTPGFRTNLGIVSTVDDPLVVALDLIDATGAIHATRNVTIPPLGHFQSSIDDFFALLETVQGRFSLTARGAPGFVLYASVIDNASGDPMFICAE